MSKFFDQLKNELTNLGIQITSGKFQKATKMSRSEAGRTAARARWGYAQTATVKPAETPQPYQVKGVEILDRFITEKAEPFSLVELDKAIREGKPVTLLGVHATERYETDIAFEGPARGSGTLGVGIYGSLTTTAGLDLQERAYDYRGRQILVALELKRPVYFNDGFATQAENAGADWELGEVAITKAFVDQGMPIRDAVQEARKRIRSGDPKRNWLAEMGYDGAIWTGKKDIVAVSSGSQIEVLDNYISKTEFQTLRDSASGISKSVSPALFDGRSFDLVSIQTKIVLKATTMSRSEAGRTAARARWGYTQQATFDTKTNAKTDDPVITVAIEEPSVEKIVEAADSGKAVTLVTVHSYDAPEPNFRFQPVNPQTGRFTGGLYSSVMDQTGKNVVASAVYGERGVVLNVSLKKPAVLRLDADQLKREQISKEDVQKYGLDIDRGMIFNYTKRGEIDSYSASLQLREKGYDGIIVFEPNSNGFTGAQVVVFDPPKSVKVLDPNLTPSERAAISKQKQKEIVFDGSGYTYLTLEEFLAQQNTEPVIIDTAEPMIIERMI